MLMSMCMHFNGLWSIRTLELLLHLGRRAAFRGRLPPPDRFTPEAFKRYICNQMSVALQNRKSPTAFLDLVPELDKRFPKGAKVEPQGLTKTELNGLVGTVAGRYDVLQGRVGIEFPAPHGVLSVRATCLEPEETYEEFSRRKMAEYGFS